MSAKRILFATDFDEAARHARAEVAAVAVAFGAQVHVVNVLPSPLRAFVSSTRDEDEATTTLSEWTRELQSAGAEALVAPIARGNAAEAIVELAERLEVQLIMVGASNKSTLERLVTGSTAEAIARSAHQPVWISRPPHAGIKRVVVGVDGSDASRVAVEDALAITQRAGASLDVVAALDKLELNPLGMTAKEEDAARERFRESQEHDIRAFLAASRSDGSDVAHFAWGEAHDVLATFVHDNDADVLVVGRSGSGGVRRVLLGTTAERLLRTCPCSLVLTGSPTSQP